MFSNWLCTNRTRREIGRKEREKTTRTGTTLVKKRKNLFSNKNDGSKKFYQLPPQSLLHHSKKAFLFLSLVHTKSIKSIKPIKSIILFHYSPSKTNGPKHTLHRRSNETSYRSRRPTLFRASATPYHPYT